MSDLVQSVYVSDPSPGLTLRDVHQIVASAQAFNQQNDISGLLLVTATEFGAVQSFMQWIEGPRASIDACMARILSDSRHTNVSVIRNEPVDARSYPTWSMHLEPVTADQMEGARSRLEAFREASGDLA